MDKPVSEMVDAARDRVQEALMDSQYLAGATAGWNAAQSDDPEAAFAAIQRSREGHLSGFKQAKAILAGHADAVRKALLVFAACARDLGENVPDDEWAKFRLLASDYRRAYRLYVSLYGEPPYPEDAHSALAALGDTNAA